MNDCEGVRSLNTKHLEKIHLDLEIIFILMLV